MLLCFRVRSWGKKKCQLPDVQLFLEAEHVIRKVCSAFPEPRQYVILRLHAFLKPVGRDPLVTVHISTETEQEGDRANYKITSGSQKTYWRKENVEMAFFVFIPVLLTKKGGMRICYQQLDHWDKSREALCGLLQEQKLKHSLSSQQEEKQSSRGQAVSTIEKALN